MTTTPRGATELVSGQAVPETTVNEQVRHTEAGACHFIVADDDLTAPPGACADGASYIIAATATGLWAGKEEQIATAMGTNAASGWTYHVPVEGFTAYIQDENARFLYDGSDWVLDASGSVTTASTTETLTGTDAAKAVTPDALAALWEQGADVASAGTISLGEGGYFNVTGTTAITDIDFATDKAGRMAWIKFAGILTLTNGANLILPTGANITTAAGDTACFISEGSDVVRCVAYQRASGSALVDATGGGGGSGIPIVTGHPSTIAIKGTTAGTPGTGAFTPNAASSGYKAWSTVFTGWAGLVRFEDGSNWEHSFCYWNGTTLSRSATQLYESSSGSAISLTSSATATLLMDADTFIEQRIGATGRGYLSATGTATANLALAFDATNISSPAGLNLSSAGYLEEQTRTRFTSATTANAATGRTSGYSFMVPNSTAGRGGGLFAAKFGCPQLPTAPRLVVGCGGHPGGATEPSAVVAAYVWVGFDSTDSNMQFIVNDNSGSGTKTDTGIPIATAGWYSYACWNLPGTLEWHQLLIREDTGAIYYRKTSTDVPPSGTGIGGGVRAMLTATTGTAFILDLGHILVKSGR